jgi:hypothetical protein
VGYCGKRLGEVWRGLESRVWYERDARCTEQSGEQYGVKGAVGVLSDKQEKSASRSNSFFQYFIFWSYLEDFDFLDFFSSGISSRTVFFHSESNLRYSSSETSLSFHRNFVTSIP